MYFTAAVESTVAANVLVILASNPIFSAIFSYLLLEEVMPLRTIITCIICFGAIILIFSSQLGGSSNTIEGNMYALIASVTLGEYLVLIRLAEKYETRDADFIFCILWAFVQSSFGKFLQNI